MDDNILSYLIELEGFVSETMVKEQCPTRELALTQYVLSQIATKVGAENFQVTHAEYRSAYGSCLGEIFGYNESSNQEVLTLFYTIYKPVINNQIVVLNDSDIQYAWNRLQGFYNKAIRGLYFDMNQSNPAYEISKMIDDHKNGYHSIRFYILSNCSIKKSEPKKIRIINKETDSNVWDIKKLFGNLTDSSDHVEINVDFEQDSDYNMFKIPYIQMNPNNHGYRCLLMMFPAKLLYKLYKKWNTDLLLYNVRFWLTFKKTKKKHTNSDIRETLINEKEMFLAYNNGLTAIATGVSLDEYNEKTNVGESEEGSSSNDMVSMGILKSISNFQIVNGGQTTASIFKTKEADTNNVNLVGAFVQVKLIVIEGNNDVNKLASKISKSSNSQNAVKDSDFSVSEQFNTKLQELSETLMIPNAKGDISYWFYERIRGQYEEELSRCKTIQEKDAFEAKYPKLFKFNKELLSIIRKSWELDPSDAVLGSGTTYDLFITKIVENGFTPDEQYFKDTVALLIIYMFMNARPENKKYGNAKASVLAYSLAYLHYIAFNAIDLNIIWEKQSISESQKEGINMLCDIMYSKLYGLAYNNATSILSYGKRKNAFTDICDSIPSRVMLDIKNKVII